MQPTLSRGQEIGPKKPEHSFELRCPECSVEGFHIPFFSFNWNIIVGQGLEELISASRISALCSLSLYPGSVVIVVTAVNFESLQQQYMAAKVDLNQSQGRSLVDSCCMSAEF